MIIGPARVDEFLKAKGIAFRMSDDEWSEAITRIARCLGSGRHFCVKLLHQREDSLRRSHSNFPEGLPEPLRFIDYIEFFGVGGRDGSFAAMMEREGIPHCIFTEKNGPEDDDIATLVRVGPRQNERKAAQPGATDNPGDAQ